MPIIHEFSTGIQVEKLSEGKWQSRGFTAEYSNSTLPAIPFAVQREIANKRFAVVEGTETKEPAIIGREVHDQPSNNWWSVVALVTEGQDEIGRPISVTRYFLTEGKKNLFLIIAWIYSFKEQKNKLPVFDPTSLSTEIDFNPENITVETKNLPEKMAQQKVVSLPNEYNLYDINQCASDRVSGDEAITWAVNVEALYKPEQFILIQAASPESCHRIKQSINIDTSSIFAGNFDEQQVSTAIKTLTINSNINKTAVEIIAEAFENHKIQEENWSQLFNDEGATTAIQENIYSSQLARLLSLRIFAPYKPEMRDNLISELILWLEDAQDHVDTVKSFLEDFIHIYPESDFINHIIESSLEFRLYQIFKGEKNANTIKKLLNISSDNAWKKHLSHNKHTQYNISKRERWDIIYQDNLIYKRLSNLITQESWEDFENTLIGKKYHFSTGIWKPLFNCLPQAKESLIIESNKTINIPDYNTIDIVNDEVITRADDNTGLAPPDTKEKSKKARKNNGRTLKFSIFLWPFWNSLFNYSSKRMKPQDQKKSIQSIHKTVNSLKVMADKIHHRIADDFRRQRDDIEKIIYQKLFCILFDKTSKNNIQINSSFVEYMLDKSKSENLSNGMKNELVEAIFMFQKQHDLIPSGIIITSQEDKTMRRLDKEVVKELRSPLKCPILAEEYINKAKNDFENHTKRCLKEIAEPYYKHSNISDFERTNKVFSCVYECMNINILDSNIPYSKTDYTVITLSNIDIHNEPYKIYVLRWINAIAYYQFTSGILPRNKDIKCGVLKQNDEVYQSLVTNLHSKLGS